MDRWTPDQIEALEVLVQANIQTRQRLERASLMLIEDARRRIERGGGASLAPIIRVRARAWRRHAPMNA